jgi:hypothetical protein
MKQTSACYLLRAGFLLFDLKNADDMVSETSMTFIGMNGLMSQKIQLIAEKT